MRHPCLQLPRSSSSLETPPTRIRPSSVTARFSSLIWYAQVFLSLLLGAEWSLQGADKIWRLKLSDNKLSLTGNIPQPEGSGPRHMEILDKQLFVLHENDNTLTVQPLPASPTGKSSITSTVSIVPPGVPAKSTFAAAELLIPANSTAFPTSFIYASNRNIGPDFDPRGDAVAILQNTNGKLSVVGHAFTGLTNIRSMRFGGPDKRYLIVGSATAGGVAVFERTSGGKNLTLVARDATIPIRTSFAWLE
jgi:6-phosphogluconolactonase (cycloisomerase 2 family)